MGPIERAAKTLPQFLEKRTFEYNEAIDGLGQTLWGVFKKVVIADSCAEYVYNIFNHYQNYSSSVLILGIFLFGIQLYTDFSGYSDIAIGIARLFNIELTTNFAYPYFSRNMAEFWRRWHITLYNWLSEYVFKPLQIGLRNLRVWGNIFAISVTFIVCGFWHGANLTFLIWGLINALAIIPLLFVKKRTLIPEIAAKGNLFPSLKEIFQIISTFSITLFAWIFFRSDNINVAFGYIGRLFSLSAGKEQFSFNGDLIFLISTILAVMCFEWLQRTKKYPLQFEEIRIPKHVKWGIYYILMFAILWFKGSQNSFVYFQF